MDSNSQDVGAVIERLESQDIDVVRVSYSDMIGIDRGRDVLLSELPAALGHGEFEAVNALIRRGARINLTVAAGLGRIEDARRLLGERRA